MGVGPSPPRSSELLIEAALAQTSSRPTILVIDALDRLQNFKGESGTNVVGKPTQDCINAFEKVKKGGIPLGTDDPPGCCTVDSFYNYVDYMDPTNFHELSLPRPAEKAHLSNPDGSMPNRVKWQYHYLQVTSPAHTFSARPWLCWHVSSHRRAWASLSSRLESRHAPALTDAAWSARGSFPFDPDLLWRRLALHRARLGARCTRLFVARTVWLYRR